MQNQFHIRNFAIIAHIDHGKSTLADRLLEMTGTIQKRQMQEQILDSNPIERERGITIKLAPVRMIYHAQIPITKIQDPNKSQIQTSNKQTSLEIENWKLKIANSKQEFILNLIDTPGHVDFNYEVSRSLAACEGAVLVVDATQGVQAQTLANLNLARKQNLTAIPVINKIDLPNAQIDKTRREIYDLGFKKEDIIEISAKTGTHVDILLRRIVEVMPSPKGDVDKPLRALIFSSQYDPHKGVVVYVRIVDGEYKYSPTSKVTFMASGMSVMPIEVGYFTPKMQTTPELRNGEVGYIATGLKDVRLAKVGDTITNFQFSIFNFQKRTHSPQLATHLPAIPPLAGRQVQAGNLQSLPGYKEPKPMVFLGLFPIQSDEIHEVRDALSKLRLSDSAFTFKPISSLALGNGFHCGFLGLLHAEVVQERLSREFGLNLLATAPTVEYLVRVKGSNAPTPPLTKRGQGGVSVKGFTTIQSATEFPDPSTIEETREPVMEVTIFSPKKYVGAIMQLCQSKRGEYIDMTYIGTVHNAPGNSLNNPTQPPLSQRGGEEGLRGVQDIGQVKLIYLMPLSEMIIDFFDQLKSVTEGYASLDYEFFDYQSVEVVKLDILFNKEKVDAFSQLVVSDRAEALGRRLVERLAEVIPRQQFEVPIQAAIGGKVIARADVKAFRKDVIQKLYGGDRTRKDKLLEAQKKGKKKMKLVGRVEIPQEAFLKVFKES